MTLINRNYNPGNINEIQRNQQCMTQMKKLQELVYGFLVLLHCEIKKETKTKQTKNTCF